MAQFSTLRLHEFAHPVLPKKVRFRRAFVPVAESELADRLGASLPFPAADLATGELSLEGSDRNIQTHHIAADRDSAFDTTPHVLLNAGTHGDEHESMQALASLVRLRELPREFSYDIIFCANPHGFQQNTRENAQGIDINRSFFNDAETTPEAKAIMGFVSDRRYVGVKDMHEDFEGEGTYIYEDVRDFDRSVLAPAIKTKLQELGLPLQHLDEAFDLGPTRGSNAIVHRYEPGIVLADAAAESIAFQSPGMMLTTKLLLSGITTSTLRIETGQRLAPDSRIAAQKHVVLTALQAMLDNPEHFETPQFTDKNLAAIRAHFSDTA